MGTHDGDLFWECVKAGFWSLFCIAFVWLFAAGFNPELSSGTVWFVGAVTGFLYNTIRMGAS